jgi:hypothetical protein
LRYFLLDLPHANPPDYMRHRFLACLWVLLTLPAFSQSVKPKAKTTQKTVNITPATHRGRLVAVGNGGGITGKTTTYYLLDTGELFRKSPADADFVRIGKQTTANTKRVFWSVEDRCAIKKTTFNEPGNYYQFVRWQKGKEIYRVVWTPSDTTVPANYPKVYASFLNMIPQSLR